MSSACVFLGPSLPLEEARALLPDATFLPPVKMGDVQALVPRAPRCICIIDGYFERVPAVWHKEILHALHRGIRVIGASSMGALRAAELHALGMEGVGAVFEAYRDGTIEDDDEVALVHGPAEEGYRALSEPLVNIRFGLAGAVQRGLIDGALSARLLELARARFYPHRSWAQLFEDAGALAPPSLREQVRDARPDVKRDDARLALAAAAAGRAAPPPSFDFEPTVFWHRLVATTARLDDASPISAEVLAHARLTLPDLRDVLRQALLDELIPLEAERLGLAVTEAEISAAAECFRRERGLTSAADTRAWLDRQGLDDAAFTELMRLDALLEKLLDHHQPALRRRGGVVRELRRQGRYAALAEEAARKRAAHEEVEPPGEAELLEWHGRRLGPLAGTLESHARRRGFGSRFEFLDELAKSYHADRRRR